MAGAAYSAELSRESLGFLSHYLDLDPSVPSLLDSGASLRVLYHEEGDGFAVDGYLGRVPTELGELVLYRGAGGAPDEGLLRELHVDHVQGNGPVCADRRLPSLLLEAGGGEGPAMEGLGYSRGGTYAAGDLLDKAVSSFFGLDPELELQRYERERLSLRDRLGLYVGLMRDEPEYAVLALGELASQAGSGLCMGAAVPSIWAYGSVLGVAGTLSSVQQAVAPGVTITTSTPLGGLLDRIKGSDEPVAGMKRLRAYEAAVAGVTALSYTLAQPEVMACLPDPTLAVYGLVGTATAAGTGLVLLDSQARLAARDELLGRSDDPAVARYRDHLYQILGTERSADRAVYLSSYLASAAVTGACPPLKLPLAAAGGLLWAGGKLAWALYRKGPPVEVEVAAGSAIEGDGRLVTDMGWTIELGEGGRWSVEEREGSYVVGLHEGSLRMTYDGGGELTLDHETTLAGRMPGPVQRALPGTKERWEVEVGAPLRIARRSGSARLSVGLEGDGVLVELR